MKDEFDELARALAQSTTRRQALKRFGAGLAGIALACFGLATRGKAATCFPSGWACKGNSECCSGRCVNYGGKSVYGLPKKYCA